MSVVSRFRVLASTCAFCTVSARAAKLSGLVESGLLEVTPDPADSRANIVRLTTPGRVLVDSAWRGLEHHQSGLDAGVDEPALVAQLDRIISNAEEALS